MSVGYRAIVVGLFGTFDGRFRTCDQGIAVGTVIPTPTSGFPAGTGYQQAYAWAEEALSFWSSGNAVAYPVTPNSASSQDRLVPNLADVLRRDDLEGQFVWRGVDTNVGGASQTVAQYGPFDVIIRWDPNPLGSLPGDAGTDAADAVTVCDPETRTYIITVQDELHLDKGERYYKEVIWHELGHVVQGLVAESIGDDAYQRLNQRMFDRQAAFNTGLWAGRGVESFAEQFKDTFFPLRVDSNQTSNKIRNGRQLNAFHDFLQTLYVPQGPHDYIDDTVPYYGKAGQPVRLDGFPHPIPLFDYGSEFHPDYDFPVMVEIDTTAGVGVMWKWGGMGSPFAGTGPRQRPYGVASDYRKPPPAGSTVTFRARWENPLGPFAETPSQDLTNGTWPGADFAGSDLPVAGGNYKPVLPIGVVGIDVGPRECISETETDEAWWIGNHGQGNICWSAAGPGDTNWTSFVVPQELKQETWEEIPRDKIGVSRPYLFTIPRWEPIYFDMRQAGTWEMTFTVPPHDGELAIQFLIPAQKKGSANVKWPIRTYYSGTYWSVAPRPLGFEPEILPEGNLQVHARAGGWKRSREDWARAAGQFRTTGHPGAALTRG